MHVTWNLYFFTFPVLPLSLINYKFRMGFVDCIICGKTFSSRQTLNIHLWIHTNELPFKCGPCDKRYGHQCNLDYHIRSAHTGERPFKCENCGATFYSNSDLKSHRYIHLSVKPHSCQFCGKGFIRAAVLRSHLLRHIEERHFPCDHCFKEFYDSTGKKRHCLSAHLQVNDPKEM